MKVRSYKKEDIVVVEPQVKFLAGADVVKELDEKLGEVLKSEGCNVIIDFCKADWIYSAIISLLLGYNEKFTQLGGKIKLANLNPEVHKVLTVTRLAEVFETYPSLDEAVSSF